MYLAADRRNLHSLGKEKIGADLPKVPITKLVKQSLDPYCSFPRQSQMSFKRELFSWKPYCSGGEWGVSC